MTKRLLALTGLFLLQIIFLQKARAQESTGLNFDGVNDYVGFSGLALGGTTGTIECWVSLEAFGTTGDPYRCIVYNGTTTQNGFGLVLENAQLCVLIGNRTQFKTNYYPTLNTLTHYALSISSTLVVVTVNGQLVYFNYLNSSTTPLTPTGSFMMGQSQSGQVYKSFKGTLDEVRVWSTSRTTEEIAAKYNCKISGYNFPAGLEHYYDFSGGTPGAFNSSSYVADKVFENLSGTLYNFTQNGNTSNYVTGKVFPADIAVYVDAAATGSNNGSSWANAFTNLDDALSYAANLNCGTPEIWIAKGTYYPGKDANGNPNPADPRDKVFAIAKNVKLYGGFAGTETSINGRVAGNNTILSGDIGVRGDASDNCYHVLASTDLIFAIVSLDRLVITDGNANGTGSTASLNRSDGGGFISRGLASFDCKNVVFANNKASGNGGGMFLRGRRFGGFVDEAGGASLTQCIFYGNTASSGAAMAIAGSDANLYSSVVAGNQATSQGYAVNCFSNFAPYAKTSFFNSISYGNSGTGETVGNVYFNNCITQTSNVGGSGNTQQNPFFVDAANPPGADGKWMTADDGLRAMSCAAIDNGRNSDNPSGNTLDIALQPRLTDLAYVAGGSAAAPIIDLGAYENQQNPNVAGFSGVIGTSHTIPFPHQRIPDTIKAVVPAAIPMGASVVYSWEQNTDGLNWVPANPASTDSFYVIPATLSATASYRRITEVCGIRYVGNVVTISVLNPPSGVISGRIVDRNGSNGIGNGVEGIEVSLQKTVDLPGSPISFVLKDTTDSEGKFSFDPVFWGDEQPASTTTFKITPFRQGHEFDFPSLQRTLTFNSRRFTDVNFRDLTAFIVSGTTLQQCNDCLVNGSTTQTGVVTAPLDSAEIFKNNQYVLKTGFINTPAPGGFGRFAVTVDIPGQYNFKAAFKDHIFIQPSRNIQVADNVSGVDFIDTTTHVISGYLTAGCQDYIGRAIIEFSDVLPDDANNQPRPSVFRKRVTTDANGFYSVRLPARKYKATVVGMDTLAITDVRNPAYINPLAIPRFFENYPNADTLLIRDITTRDTIINFVYHRKPSIQLSALENSCTRTVNSIDSSFVVMKQLVPKQFIINVFDGPVSKGCPLKADAGTAGDFVRLLTNVQVDDLDEDLRFSLNGVGKDTIILNPGIPNIFPPYFKQLRIYYQDRFNRPDTQSTAFLTRNIVVEGYKQDTATFTTVSPQIPLMVLHDPPGDASSSYWESSKSNEMAIRFSAATTNSLNTWAEVKLGTEFSAGIGVTVPTSIWGTLRGGIDVSGRLSSENETIVTTTTTNNFSTASNPEVVGSSGDVFIGTALNLLYSRATVIKYNGGCNVTSDKQLVFAENGFRTKYVYTESYIKDYLIPELEGFANTPSLSQARRDSFANQLSVWQQVLHNNDINKERAELVENISFEGNDGPITSSTSTSSSKSNTIAFDMEINTELALSLGLDIGGSGVSGGVTVGVKMEQGRSNTNTVTNTTTTGYTLDDDDPGDRFSVDIKKDPVYNTPVFTLVAGTSSCPREPGTQPRDEFQLTVDNPIATGVAVNDAAVYVFRIRNSSQSNETRTYRLYFEQASNPYGASVTVGGNPAPSGSEYFTYQIAYGAELQVVITVRKGPLAVYSYEGLQFSVTDNCDGGISKTARLSAFFTSPCSDVILNKPGDSWVNSSADNNVIPVQFSGYTLSNLTSVSLEYAPVGLNNWTTGFTRTAANLSNSADGTIVNWDVTGLRDSTYSLRLKLSCPSGVIYTQRVIGTIDRQAPEVFGRPDPTDDNYVPGDVIGISYNEKISNINLNNNRVTMKRLSTNTTIPVQVSGYENKLAIVPLSNIMVYAGETIQVVVKNISDQYGNTKLIPDTFAFIVGTPAAGTGPAINLSIANATIAEAATSTIDVVFKLAQAVTDSSLRINYTVGGNAVYPQDYTVSYLPVSQPGYVNHSGVGGSIVIPRGADSAVLKIRPVDNTFFEPVKNIILSLAEGSKYRIGNNYSVTGAITNDDQQTVYTFTGNGNFSNPAAWQNGEVPPAALQTGDEIIINPSGGTCILNIPLTILPGGKLTVLAGKNLIIQRNLIIRN